jgi:HD-GYP domain-containing protein (c-di-GMP phosphodiesterase class II)
VARAEVSAEAGRQFDPAVVDAFVRELEHPSAAPKRSGSGTDARAALAAAVVSHVNELLRDAA